jgi:hypothetical protein
MTVSGDAAGFAQDESKQIPCGNDRKKGKSKTKAKTLARL